MQADEPTRAAAEDLLSRYLAAHVALDPEKIIELYSEDADSVMVGPDAHEVYRGINAIADGVRKRTARWERAILKFTTLEISAPRGASPPAAWAYAQIDGSATIQGKVHAFSARFTAVLERQGKDWLIAQSHFSFSSPSVPY